jgi:hypothetical protein
MCLVSNKGVWCMGRNEVGSVVSAVWACVWVGSAVDDFWLASGGI